MKKIAPYLFSIFIFLFLGLWISIKKTHAQQVSLEIKPTKYTIVSKPDTTITIPLQIQNISDPTMIKLQIVSLKKNAQTGSITQEALTNTPINFSLIDTPYTFDEPFLITHKEIIPLSIQTHIQKTAEERDYLVGLIAETLPPQPNEGEVSLGIHTLLTVPILFQISSDGTDTKEFRITLFDLRPQFKIPFFKEPLYLYDTNSPIPLVILAQNTGKHTTQIQGSIAVRNMSGLRKTHEITQIDIYPDTEELLHVRENNNNKNNSLILNNLQPGFHTISTTIYDTQKTRILSKQKNIIVLPLLTIIIIISIFFIGTIIGIAFYIKKKNIDASRLKKRRQHKRRSLHE